MQQSKRTRRPLHNLRSGVLPATTPANRAGGTTAHHPNTVVSNLLAHKGSTHMLTHTHLPGCTRHQTTPTSRPSSAAAGQAHTQHTTTMSCLQHHATRLTGPPSVPCFHATHPPLRGLSCCPGAAVAQPHGPPFAWQQAANTTQHVSLRCVMHTCGVAW